MHPVHGRVLYKNQPLSGATVTFHPAARGDVQTDLPVGQTQDDGTFFLATGGRIGAPVGEYTVTIVCMELPKTASTSGRYSTGGNDPQDRLAGAYANPAKSKLTAVLKSGTNQLEPFVLP
jgi:hypothetical protein